MTDILHQIGLILLGGVFLWAGAEHFFRFPVVAASLAEKGFPAPRFLLAAGSVLQIAAGFCLATGIGVVYAAAALAAFTVSATVMMLDFWHHTGDGREALRTGFIANVAVLGGLIVAASSDLQ